MIFKFWLKLFAINISNDVNDNKSVPVMVIVPVYVIFQLPAGRFNWPELFPVPDVKPFVEPVFVVVYPKRVELKRAGL